MLSDYFPRAAHRYTSLPLLGSFAERFHGWLLTRGFRRRTRKRHLRALWHIDRALRRRGRRRWSEVTPDDVEACWRWFRRHGAIDPGTIPRLEQFLAQEGGGPRPSPRRPGRVDALTSSYAAWLGDLRGLTPATVRQHTTTAAAFLTHIGYEARPSRLAAITARDLETFVRRAGARLCRGSLQHTGARLRSFLTFLAFRGAVRPGLERQIDMPRLYRFEQLPRSLPWPTVRGLLRSIDRSTPQGLRDYTLFFLVATYGLRVSDAITLTVDGIDWRRRQIQLVQAKTGTPLLLPLTDAVGNALVRYLRHSRPLTPLRQLFVRARAPIGVLTSSAVGEAFKRWVRRSGLPIRPQGPHCLRHSQAVHLLRRRVPVKTIGDLLGHRAAESTWTYLRLATADLRDVALPLPRPTAPEGRR